MSTSVDQEVTEDSSDLRTSYKIYRHLIQQSLEENEQTGSPRGTRPSRLVFDYFNGSGRGAT